MIFWDALEYHCEKVNSKFIRVQLTAHVSLSGCQLNKYLKANAYALRD